MIPGYAVQQMHAATSTLACGLGSLQSRLESAYKDLEPLIAADFPDKLGKDYADIISRLTWRGSAAETTAAMSDGEASHVASLVLALHFATEAARSGKEPASSASEVTIEAGSPLAVR